MSGAWHAHDGETLPEGRICIVRRRDGHETSELLGGNWFWLRRGTHADDDVVGYFALPLRGRTPFDAVAQQYLKRADVLDAARQAVTVDRAATHGGVEDSFNRIAAIWSVHLGVPVTGAQVALMLAELKVVRAWGNPTHADNWCDLAGYAACGGELSGAAKP